MAMMGPNEQLPPLANEEAVVFALIKALSDPETSKERLQIWFKAKQEADQTLAKAMAQTEKLQQLHSKNAEARAELTLLRSELAQERATFDQQQKVQEQTWLSLTKLKADLEKRETAVNDSFKRLDRREMEQQQISDNLARRQAALEDREAALKIAQADHASRVEQLKSFLK